MTVSASHFSECVCTFSLKVFFLIPVAIIGIRQQVYSIREDGGDLEVEVLLVNGTLSDTASITFNISTSLGPVNPATGMNRD